MIMYFLYNFWGPLAQLVEQLTFNQLVIGSIPIGLTKVILISIFKIYLLYEVGIFSFSFTVRLKISGLE